jgi:hypothetical protein
MCLITKPVLLATEKQGPRPAVLQGVHEWLGDVSDLGLAIAVLWTGGQSLVPLWQSVTLLTLARLSSLLQLLFFSLDVACPSCQAVWSTPFTGFLKCQNIKVIRCHLLIPVILATQ